MADVFTNLQVCVCVCVYACVCTVFERARMCVFVQSVSVWSVCTCARVCFCLCVRV